MKLILNSDVKSLGRKGDVVDVAKGYARNYLLPKKLAVVANSSNLKFAEALREKREIQAVANNELAESIKTALADAKIVISQNTTDEGTLYAAVSNEQIVDAIETFSGFRLEAEQIDVENQVKEIGEWLMEIHSQNAHQKLLIPDYQRKILDDFGNIKPDVEKLKTYWEKWNLYKHKLDEAHKKNDFFKQKKNQLLQKHKIYVWKMIGYVEELVSYKIL